MTMKILIADDDTVSRMVLSRTLTMLGFEVTEMNDGAEVLEYLRHNEARLIISDWMMPRVDGLELCRQVRLRGKGGPYVYMILLTAKHRREDRLKGLQAGADDFLIKPLDKAELFARINVARRIIEMEGQIRNRTAELERIQAELEQRNALLAEMATSDGLTGLKNHRFFRESLDAHFSLARRKGLALSLAMIDVDQFKQFNDAFGHPAGDDVIRGVAHALKSCVRDHDLVARYGGEEFAVLMPASDADASRCLCERLRAHIEQHPWPFRPITISVGIATLSTQVPRPGEMIELADRSLYHSKAQGRNCVTHGEDLLRALHNFDGRARPTITPAPIPAAPTPAHPELDPTEAAPSVA